MAVLTFDLKIGSFLSKDNVCVKFDYILLRNEDAKMYVECSHQMDELL